MDEVVRNQTRAGYDAVAAAYVELIPDTRSEATPDLAMVQHFVDSLTPAAEAAAVLDAGCGTGRMISHLHGLGPSLDITGLDLSPGMIAEARATHPDRPLDVGDLADLPYADGSFDGVLAWYSIIHTPPHGLAPVFAECARVLRRGGALLVGYQAGTGHRWLVDPYGVKVTMQAYLHHTPYVTSALDAAGLVVDATLDRGPTRDHEKHAQGFVLARRP